MTWIKRHEKTAWFCHNMVAHPLSELCWWTGHVWAPIRSWGNWLHDATVPDHAPGTGRG